MKLIRLVSDYRWPIYLAGLLLMPIVACAVLVYVATGPDAPLPIDGYYEAARTWDADEAVEEQSEKLGWNVRFEFPSDVPHFPGMPRPIDVRISDRDGHPINGLVGELFAVRPANTRLNQTAGLVEIPQQAGSYRTLVRLDAPGAWDFRIDARQDGLRFVHAARLTVIDDPSFGEEESR